MSLKENVSNKHTIRGNQTLATGPVPTVIDPRLDNQFVKKQASATKALLKEELHLQVGSCSRNAIQKLFYIAAPTVVTVGYLPQICPHTEAATKIAVICEVNTVFSEDCQTHQ